MAQKRMINKKISVSEQVADLSIQAQLLFTWSIPHADDVGVLPHSHRTLKALIVPMWNILLPDFDKIVAEIMKQGLWKEIEYNEQKFYGVTKFRDHQTLKKDRQPQILLDIVLDKDFKTSWKTVEEVMERIGFHVEDNGFQLDTEEKRTEEKRTELKRSEARATEKVVNETFEIFWVTYPNKVSKKKALQAWQKIAPRGELLETIMQGLEKAKKSAQWIKDGGQFVPHPTTWLNQERWNDEVITKTSRRVDKV